MRTSRFSIVRIVGVMLLVLGLSVNATALPIDSTTIYLTVPNTALLPYTGPYASIQIDLMSSTTASVIVTGLTSGNLQYLLGGEGAVDLSTLGSAATATNFSDSSFSQYYNSHKPDPYTQNISDFGLFNVVIDGTDGYTDAVKSLTFDLINNSLTSWSTATGVLTLNDKDFLAAGHIFVQDTENPTSALMTGYAGNGSTKVPEPGTMLLLGSGLLGLGLLGRKKFRK